jgi:hypothetical protein
MPVRYRNSGMPAVMVHIHVHITARTGMKNVIERCFRDRRRFVPHSPIIPVGAHARNRYRISDRIRMHGSTGSFQDPCQDHSNARKYSNSQNTHMAYSTLYTAPSPSTQIEIHSTAGPCRAGPKAGPPQRLALVSLQLPMSFLCAAEDASTGQHPIENA